MLYRSDTQISRDESGRPFFWLVDRDSDHRVRVIIALPGFDEHFSDAPRNALPREHYEGIKSSVSKTAVDLYQAGKVEGDGSVIVRPEHFDQLFKGVWGGTWPW